MKCKKLVSLAMAGVMTLALAAPAMAEDTVITGMYKDIKVDVKIPAAADAVINPYGMPVKAIHVKADKTTEEVGTILTAGKLATQPLIGYNFSEAPMMVGATVTGEAIGDLMLSNKALTSSVKTKSALVYLECKQDTTLQTADMSDGTAAADKMISNVKGASALTAVNDWPATTYSATAANQVLVGATSATKENMCLLREGAISGGEMKPQQGSFMVVRLGGDVVKNPSSPWAETDGVKVTVAFTFVPAVAQELDPTAITIDGTSKVVSITLPEGVVANDDTTYEWEVLAGGTSDADLFDATADATGASGKLMKDGSPAASAASAGTAIVKCTVDIYGAKYVCTQTVTQP